MVMNDKKIVVIREIPSNIIEEAIFVLRNSSKCNKDFVATEARSIIEDYISQQNKQCKKNIAEKPGNAAMPEMVSVSVIAAILLFSLIAGVFIYVLGII